MAVTRRPAHRNPRLLALIVLGGALGTTARHSVQSAFPADAGGFPWATLAVNVSGAFLLAALLELVVLVPDDRGRRRALRLGLGTGLLGGYTTYSTFVLESLTLGGSGHPLAALAYDAVSLTGGFLAAWLAATAVGRLVRRRAAGSLPTAGVVR